MDEALIKKVMPHSLEAEQSVIGSMIIDPEAIIKASETLTPEDFYHQQFAVMFKTMVDLRNTGKAVDIITLQNGLKAEGLPQEYQDVGFLNNLVMTVPTSANIEHYAKIVKDKAMLRKVIKATEGIANTCYLAKDSVDVILDRTEKEVFDIVNKRGGSAFESIQDIVVKSLESIEVASRNKGGVTGISTGFLDLDYKTAGLQNSDLILIAARPAMGKTAFVLNLAEHMAVKSGVTTAIFTLEMSKEQLVKRILSMNTHVDSQAIRTGNLSEEQWEMLVEGAREIGASNLIIDDTPAISIGELRSKCRKYKLSHNLGIVIIDYLQLMTGNTKTDSRQQEVAEISRSLKALARELNIPIVALSQLSRAVEARPDKRPMMSDLRESGAIEQDADIVMFIYRDDYYNKDSEEKGVAEIIIGKQRSGPVGTVKLKWQGELTRFTNLEH